MHAKKNMNEYKMYECHSLNGVFMNVNVKVKLFIPSIYSYLERNTDLFFTIELIKE
jgi:hypothetical protein